jgi:hypothetical protein
MKILGKDRPLGLFGRLVIEFPMNDDLAFRDRSLREIVKGLEREFRASAAIVHDRILEDPGRGCLIVALCGAREESVRGNKEKLLAYVDQNAAGRLVLDDWEELQMDLG